MKITLLWSANKSYRNAVERGKPYKGYAPLTLILLAALIPPELHAEVELIDLVREKRPKKFDCNLLGISTITCGAPEAYRIAAEARQAGITVVLGGAHPTALSKEALKHADAVVIGYAERTWPQLLRDYKNKTMKRIYSDFSNPFTLPLPHVNHNLQKGKKYFFNNIIEISRGCPNHCSFCVVNSLNGGNNYISDLHAKLNEISTLGKRILFIDSNHTENYECMLPLWLALKERKIQWLCAGSLRFAQKTELVKLISSCGCRGMLIGFESINAGSLSESNKSYNQIENYLHTVQVLHDNGISVLGCFVFGFDHDDPSVFERTVALVQKSKMDIVRYAIATPFPGSNFYRMIQEQNRFITHDWEFFDTEHVVYKPKKMTAEQLYNGHRWAYRETYKYSAIVQRLFGKNFQLLTLGANYQFRNVAFTFDISHTCEDILE